jgi:uncharacterized protein (TIGR02466 family)
MPLGTPLQPGNDLLLRSRIRAHDLFPTRIWQAKIKDRLPPLEGLVAAALAMRAAQPEPAGRTNRQGWNSSDLAVLDRPDFSAIDRLVREAIAVALGEMGQAERPYGLQSWINLHDKGGFNFLHVHEGAYLSGCFYLRVPPGSGSLMFRDPRPGVVHGFVKGPVANGYRDIGLRPEDGLLVLFPCWLEHFVEPHTGEEPRIVIAFNATPPG